MSISGARDGELSNVTLPNGYTEVTFGRLPDCTISLPDDPEISRLHAKLSWRGHAWWLEDLKSTNGTFVGEFAQRKKITGSVRLAACEVFQVGRSVILIETGTE